MIDKQTFTVAEVAVMTGFSRDTITRMFEKQKGVLVLSRPESMHKRSYRSLRIPQSVYERVIQKMTIKA